MARGGYVHEQLGEVLLCNSNPRILDADPDADELFLSLDERYHLGGGSDEDLACTGELDGTEGGVIRTSLYFRATEGTYLDSRLTTT